MTQEHAPPLPKVTPPPLEAAKPALRANDRGQLLGVMKGLSSTVMMVREQAVFQVQVRADQGVFDDELILGALFPKLETRENERVRGAIVNCIRIAHKKGWRHNDMHSAMLNRWIATKPEETLLNHTFEDFFADSTSEAFLHLIAVIRNRADAPEHVKARVLNIIRSRVEANPPKLDEAELEMAVLIADAFAKANPDSARSITWRVEGRDPRPPR